MVQEVEIEFKNLLTYDEYNRIYQFLPFKSVELFEQTNYYFETKDLKLREQGAALRIRHKNNKWVLTLKQPHSEGLLETHDELSPDEANLWIQNKTTKKPDVAKQLNQLGVAEDELIYLGSLTTRRCEVDYQDTTVVLDHSLYYGKEDFELEVEADTYVEGDAVFSHLLKELNIPKRPTDNKIKRFYQAKLESE
ncbi:CYTH domain-containing protein [Halobacillus salinarum]|uniref:CYTH domain-containing protein n=1 Tax=Halobacillus salinarum TaxID=2932257 RepID=A0ABY4EH81_9BACI|nr:CYTH domain-containing protein [Halobacillus salinarum]UOQ43422.1 CYTH domain-containing protein [Halobacillus salinarum]